ncbi:DUF4129 domain-containing protein [Marilutibacter chinensis]|uniref:DUF4129 domain-containing protein n=1 Tax=Marilutibacter chinensis TaxID=2912247 RepID=A0ABS9HXE4_9GAMM|nr:DUF4129 domain-containing protein [Lysobacter chinensis]MCF7223554.1 DUF4129 domain-containing protein [Lysobacter chinensis]
MNLESLTVALRPRTAWEAVELGTSLTRRHAAAIWAPWLLLTAPMLLLCSLLAWSLEAMWLAPLLMWWLKPVYDRIPLYVLSHAVFGDVPGVARTLRAQLHWGLRWMPAYLSWRRLSPVRALNLPIDMLEGGRSAAARQRRRTLTGPVYGVALLATVICLHFEFAVYLGLNALAVLFVPPEYLSDAWSDFMTVVREQPLWLDLVSNTLMWLATCAVEPFYVGAGFGLYLNRRTEIEGWDIEIVLRRLAARLAGAATPLLLAVALAGGLLVGGGLAGAPAHAQDASPAPADAPQVRPLSQRGLDKAELDSERKPGANDASVAIEAATDGGTAVDGDADSPARRGESLRKATLPRVFGRPLADADSLREAVVRAYEDPSVSPKRKVTTWQRRDRDDDDEEEDDDDPFDGSPLLEAIGAAVALVGEYGLWALLAVLVVILAATSPRWIGWLRGAVAAQRREPEPVARDALADTAPLPDDIPSAARKLWAAGRQRDALALLYRAGVEAMSARAGVVLVPGATEAACLRASRKMPDTADRDAFAAMVRLWQYAAYAGRLPDSAVFEQQLDTLSGRFGWNRRGPVAHRHPDAATTGADA